MQTGTAIAHATSTAAAQDWHALYTRHQHEASVAGTLSMKGFDVFLPLYSAVHRWKDRVKTLALPLFPCYVFLRGGLDRRFHIVSTPGVCSFVGPGGQPAAIPQAEMDAIQRTVETCLRIERHPFLKSGDWVQVITGPLAGVQGILVRQKGLNRVVISVELLQKSIAVEIQAEAVERIATRRPIAAASWAAGMVPA